VWQQDVRVIVMLTAEFEGGHIKAHNYWSQKRFGPLHLNFLSEHRASLEPARIHRRERPSAGRRRSTNPPTSRGGTPRNETPESPQAVDQPYVIVRRFTLSNDDEPFARMRELTHLQYSNWPDFGAPAHPAHLLGLVEQTDAVVRGVHAGSSSGPASKESRPVVVHCSAGCGRTGTFCTVDSVIDMLKRQRAVKPQSAKVRQIMSMDYEMTSPGTMSATNSSADSLSPVLQTPGLEEASWLFNDEIDLIEKAVMDFRLQRLSMVQSLRQFVLCYESIMEWLAEQTPRSA
jgi:tyrosine-protein phosphatase 2/3